MKFNKDALRELSQKSDAELWEQIRTIATEHGIKIPEGQPSKENLDKVRRMLDGTERMSFSNAKKILDDFRNEGK